MQEPNRALELARKIIALTDSKSEIIFKPLPQDDPVRRKPDISLAQRELSWQADIGLDAGLAETVRYFEQLVTESRVSC